MGPVSGVYNADVNEQTVQILVSNRNESEITLPCSLKLGTLQKAKTLQKYEMPAETRKSEEVHQVDHRPIEKLSEAEKEERLQFLRQNVNLDESMFNSKQKEELIGHSTPSTWPTLIGRSKSGRTPLSSSCPPARGPAL